MSINSINMSIHTPNIWRRSGSLKRNGMLETWRRFGWALLVPSSSLAFPAPPPDDTDTLRDWGSEVTGAKASSWQRERIKTGGGEGASTWIEKEWTREKERERRGHGGTNKNRKMENKRWKNKECEWDKSRCEEKTQGRASVGSQFTVFFFFFFLEESACVSITWH